MSIALRQCSVEGDKVPAASRAKASSHASAHTLGEACRPAAYLRNRASADGGSGQNSTRSSSKSRSWTRHASDMLRGLPSMAAAMVISRRKPICVNLENAIRLVSRSHHRRAIAEWTCSAVAKASQTLTSGKLNEVIDLFVGTVNASSSGGNQRRKGRQYCRTLTRWCLGCAKAAQRLP